MALLPVITLPDPRLRTKADPVACIDQSIKQLVDDMLETMYHEDGIGLAANQVGVLKRIVVVDLGREHHHQPLKMVNPEIIWKSDEDHMVQEACLSVPDGWGEVYRPYHIKVRYLDENNQSQECDAQGLLSCCIQHEIDHLDGILYVDHLSPIKKRLLIARAVKSKKRSLRHSSR